MSAKAGKEREREKRWRRSAVASPDSPANAVSGDGTAGEGDEEARERAFETRLMKAGLGLCALALIRERPRYGYELVEQLRTRGLSPTNEGSVYPLLRKMEKDGLLEMEGLVASVGGPARKYYRLTPAGGAELRRRTEAFFRFSRVVRDITGEEDAIRD
jgi:PadR family transcriptional regulator, regulatory protein PadR